jgi:hypothetical protein
MSKLPLLLLLLLLLPASAATTSSFVPTQLPSQPKENARVIVAPCSALMAAQQRWSWPQIGSAAPLSLLSAPAMQIYVQHTDRGAHWETVLRSTPAAATAPHWRFNESLSVLQLSSGAGAPAGWKAGSSTCLKTNYHNQYSNLNVGDCPTTNWRSNVKDIAPGGGLTGLLHNASDSTIRFVFRDSYNLNFKNLSICLTATWGEPCEPAEFAKLPFCDNNKSANERVDDLLSRTTVEEQAAMLSNDNANRIWLTRLSVNPNNTQDEAMHGADSPGGAPATSHVPPLGPGTGFGTSFPHALALAATLNHSLWGMVGRSIGLESRAFANQGVGGLYLRSPNLNMARDPRWGRVMETAGEDPTLVSEYGAALVKGMAGNDTTMLAAPAPKHFSCYCGPENWDGIYRWTFDAVVTDKYLTSYFFPGWRATIGTGKVKGPMCSCE